MQLYIIQSAGAEGADGAATGAVSLEGFVDPSAVGVAGAGVVAVGA